MSKLSLILNKGRFPFFCFAEFIYTYTRIYNTYMIYKQTLLQLIDLTAL